MLMLDADNDEFEEKTVDGLVKPLSLNPSNSSSMPLLIIYSYSTNRCLKSPTDPLSLARTTQMRKLTASWFIPFGHGV